MVDFAVIRAELETERSQLADQLDELDSTNPDSGLSFDDNFADSAQVAAEQGEAKALAGSLRDQLTDIEAALARLDDGSYGQCESCPERISDARLEAVPTARQCINCA